MKRLLFLLICLQITITAYGKEYTQAYEDKLIQDIMGIYTQEAVKTPDNPTGHPVDATPIILQAKHDFPFLNSATQKVLHSLISRPTDSLTLEYTADSPSGNFKIHYTKTGTNAVFQAGVDNDGNGVPDYVDECAKILDYIWAKEVDTLGYNPPPSDGWYPLGWNNGGDGKYDIYLRAFGSGILGQTTPETTQTSGSQIWTSYIELDNDYLSYPTYHSQYEWFQVTAAHEFFHAIQFGYDVYENEVAGNVVKPYWMEMSAVWMEDQVFDNINDYIYYLSGLSSIFNKPWLSLRNFDGLHPYSACIWPIFLGEKFGIGIIKDIWTRCAQTPGDNVLSATDQILNDLYGSSLNDAFREFTVWNYFTGDRANPSLFGFYSEGDLFWTKDYPPKPIKVYETQINEFYPVTDSVKQLPEDLGTTYITFKPIVDSLGGLRVYFKGNAGGAKWNASLIDYMSNDQPFEDTTIDLSPDSGVGWVFDWGRFSEISMVIARGDTISSRNFNYSYTAEFDTSLFHGFIPPSADKIYQNFPNPFIITDASSTTKFPMLLKNLTNVGLFIFTTSGELVWKHRWQNKIGDYTTAVFTAPEFIPFKWDGRNMNGEYVASGIYIYRIVTNNTSVTKKLVVINHR
jgi:hypothetical protein